MIRHAKIVFPDPIKHKIYMSDELKDLITKLLSRDPTQRIGKRKDVLEIIEHPWFKEIDFEKLCKKELDAPYKPSKDQITLKDTDNLEGQLIRNYEKEGDDLTFEKKKLIESNSKLFADF